MSFPVFFIFPSFSPHFFHCCPVNGLLLYFKCLVCGESSLIEGV